MSVFLRKLFLNCQYCDVEEGQYYEFDYVDSLFEVDVCVFKEVVQDNGEDDVVER